MCANCVCPLCDAGFKTVQVSQIKVGPDAVLITSAGNAAQLMALARALSGLANPVLLLDPPKPPELTPQMIEELEPKKQAYAYIPPPKRPGESGAFYESLFRRSNY